MTLFSTFSPRSLLLFSLLFLSPHRPTISLPYLSREAKYHTHLSAVNSEIPLTDKGAFKIMRRETSSHRHRHERQQQSHLESSLATAKARRREKDFSPQHVFASKSSIQGGRFSVSAYTESRIPERREPQSDRSRDVSLSSEEFRRKTLSWRLDPEESFSDWTLEVSLRSSSKSSTTHKTHHWHDETKVYHTHSNVICWGPRKGDVFSELFQKCLERDPTNKVSHLELTGQECDAFPLLLDFMYCESSLPLSPDRACSLYILAETFQVDSLRLAIRKHIETGLTVEQMIDFLSFTRKYRVSNELVFFANSKLCSYLVKNPHDASKVPPDVLVQILHKRQECIDILRKQNPRKFSQEWEQKRSKGLSTLIAQCLECHYNSQDRAVQGSAGTIHFAVTKENFNELTAKQHLPFIEPQAAIKILKVSSSLFSDDIEKNSEDKLAKRNLEERCLSSIATNWRAIVKSCSKSTKKNTQDLGMLMGALQGLPPHILADLLIVTTVEYESRLQRHQQQ